MDNISFKILYKPYLQKCIEELIDEISVLNCDTYTKQDDLDYSYEYHNIIFKHLSIDINNFNGKVIEEIVDNFIQNIPKFDIKYLLEIENENTKEKQRIYINKYGRKITKNNLFMYYSAE